jgi:hypothetical protein
VFDAEKTPSWFKHPLSACFFVTSVTGKEMPWTLFYNHLQKLPMNATVFVRQPNSSEYKDLGHRNFTILPRVDEFISDEVDGSRKFFQVMAVHHLMQGDNLELYAVEAEPTWNLKKGRAIGFSS